MARKSKIAVALESKINELSDKVDEVKTDIEKEKHNLYRSELYLISLEEQMTMLIDLLNGEIEE